MVSIIFNPNFQKVEKPVIVFPRTRPGKTPPTPATRAHQMVACARQIKAVTLFP